MGDSCCASYSIGAVKKSIEAELGVYVHSIELGSNAFSDVWSSYFGNVNHQVAEVCATLRNIEELQGGYNAVGFSQGGQFLRAVAERCQHTLPKMHTLVTMGAQHQGISAVPGCMPGSEAASTICKLMHEVLAEGAYLPGVRNYSVQAQYFKDPDDISGYLKFNPFLPDINNELDTKSDSYRDNLASLDRLVLFRFANDTTVVPRDSAWFSALDSQSTLVPLREQPLYLEDWIGLRQLDEAGSLVLDEVPGNHMQFTLQWFRDNVIAKYLRSS